MKTNLNQLFPCQRAKALSESVSVSDDRRHRNWLDVRELGDYPDRLDRANKRVLKHLVCRLHRNELKRFAHDRIDLLEVGEILLGDEHGFHARRICRERLFAQSAYR